MGAKRKISERIEQVPRVAPAPTHLEPAGSGHIGVESPAVQLQARLNAAISTSPWSGHVVESRAEQWPGSIRVGILLGSVGASWALFWQAARILF